jgi:hypothetical protein
MSENKTLSFFVFGLALDVEAETMQEAEELIKEKLHGLSFNITSEQEI